MYLYLLAVSVSVAVDVSVSGGCAFCSGALIVFIIISSLFICCRDFDALTEHGECVHVCVSLAAAQ